MASKNDTALIGGVFTTRRELTFTTSSFSVSQVASSIETVRGTVQDIAARARAGDTGAVVLAQQAEVRPDVPARRSERAPTRPEIQRIDVGFDRATGVADGFFANITLTVPRPFGVQSIRIMRCQVGPVAGSAPVTTLGMAILTAPKVGKSVEPLASYDLRMKEAGLESPIAGIRPDGVVGTRQARENPRLSLSQNDVQGSISIANLRGLVDNTRAAMVDRSVSLDVKTISRLAAPVEERVVLMTPNPQTSRGPLEFREIAVVPVVRDVTSYNYVDRTVIRGVEYRYYAVTVDRVGTESVRTEIVSVPVDVFVPPPPPRTSTIGQRDHVSVRLFCESKFIERFEVYRRLRDRPNSLGVRGWQRLPDVVSAAQGGVMVDRDVSPGSTYLYRVYSVDCFGNKSQTPATVQVWVHPAGAVQVEGLKLAVFAQMDRGTKTARVTVIKPPGVSQVFVERRDLTAREQVFTVPHMPGTPLLSTRDPKRHRLVSPVMYDQASSWTGFLESDERQTVFIDNTVRFDHSYQYRVYAMDGHGRRGPYAMTTDLFISRRPLLDTPVEVAATQEDGNIRVSWKDPNLPFSIDDVMGNQQDLSDYSVRSVYQVQRLADDGHRWMDYPLVTGSFMLDPLSDVLTESKGRPPLPRYGVRQTYRVAVLQSGSYHSEFCAPVEVRADRDTTVGGLWSRVSEARVFPKFVAIGWTGDESAEVWRVARCELSGQSSRSVFPGNLDFTDVAEVTPEASRARSGQADIVRRPWVPDGGRVYIDGDVAPGAFYVYRVVGVHGERESEPQYVSVYVPQVNA